MSSSNSSSSNNSKKKQEEKHLKILRDFLSLPCNKTCFDCNQRGPTYVNTTIGSFTCISCSGKLRGLTPPQRVKSVTMASFTPEEIEFLKSRGNEYCRLVWMSHYNLADLASETKDEQKFKDHLVAKYEKKRWYADPGTIADRLPVMTKVTNGETSSHQHQHQHSQQSLTAAAPVVALTNSPVARPSVPSSIASSSPSMSAKSSDLLADLDFFTGAPAAPVPASTAFSPPRKMHSSIPQSISQPSFANFQNADFFFPEISPQKSNGNHQPLQSAPFNGAMGPSVISPPKEPVANATKVPSEDRYSALKDLDAIFTTAAPTPASEPQATTQSAATNWTPSWNPAAVHQAPTAALITSTESAFASSLESTPSAWGSAFNQPASAAPPMTATASITSSSNPFLAPQTNGTQSAHHIGRASHALPWANFSTSPSSNGSTTASGFNGLHHLAAMGAPIGLTSSQSLDLSPKTWATGAGGTASVAMSANPFMQEPASFTQGRSRNPFL